MRSKARREFEASGPERRIAYQADDALVIQSELVGSAWVASERTLEVAR